MEIFEGLGIAADVGVSAATPPAAPTVSFPAASSVPVSAIFTSICFCSPFCSCLCLSHTPITAGFGPPHTVPSQFEVGSSSATIPDPVSEAAAFFARFDQPEVNDLGLVDF
nr:uncharacterized protein LOC112030130 [Quercus suber]